MLGRAKALDGGVQGDHGGKHDGIKRKHKTRDTSGEHAPADTLSAEGSSNSGADPTYENRTNRVENGNATPISVCRTCDYARGGLLIQRLDSWV